MMEWEKFYKSKARIKKLRKSEKKKESKGYFELKDYITFGKYRMCTVKEMIDENEEYLVWIKENKILKFHSEVELYRKNKSFVMGYIECKNCKYNRSECIIGYKNKFKSGNGCAKGKRRVMNEV
jgi:hypothetical protein